MRVKRNKRKPIIFGNCKEVLQTVIMFYFAANLVFGEEDSEFCKRGWSEFVEDVKHWETECLNEDTVNMSLCCNATADYFEDRYENYIKWCPIWERECVCHYAQREISRIVYDNTLSIPASWSKPNFTCPHKHIFKRYGVTLINRQKEEPNIKSPHNFSVGINNIKNIFQLYGGRNVPCTIVVNVRSCSDCKKDMWILWDNSWSVGITTFQEKVRPLLKGLIASPQLNVGPDGTHIGIITFSTEKQTRVLLDLGELQTQGQIQDFLDGLKYSDISGDGTRSGMALKMADERFSKTSPNNYRRDAGDVVMIFTYGQPIRRRGEDTFGDKYANKHYGEGLLAKDRAQSLKGKDVTVVGLAVGTESTLRRFRADIQEWSSEGKYFEANKDSLQSIMRELISASCIDPGACGCDTITTETVVAQGEKALINWVEPSLKCTSGRQANVQSKKVDPQISSPSEFGVGKHTVTYTFGYLRKLKIVYQKCLLEIDVKACKCPGVVRVNKELPGGSDKAFVSWTVPKPNCDASLSSVSPPGARNGQGYYPIGKHSVTYNYDYSSESGSFSLSCPVEITIKGKLCAGVGMDASQICCCGTIHDPKPGYACCGPKYYDTRRQRCVDFYTLVNN